MTPFRANPLGLWQLLALLTLGLICGEGINAQPAASPSSVAIAVAIEGTVFVNRLDGKQALLTRGASLQRGETVNTVKNSSARLQFSDGGETIVRPESSLVVREYTFKPDTPEQDSLFMELLKGGLRAVTGKVGKRGNQDAYRMQVSTSTIGIRGTDYSVRLCQNDCTDTALSSHSNTTTPVAARAVQTMGTVSISHNGESPVALNGDKPIYSGDTIRTGEGAYAVLAFRDNSRVTLNPGSRLNITRFEYDPTPKADAGSMFMELLKGGMRFATGLVGKRDPSSVKVRAATATIGIRGTVFEVACAADSSSDAGGEAELGDMECTQSVFTRTRDGATTLLGSKGPELVVHAGQSARVDSDTPARHLDSTPQYFQNQQTPEPENVNVNLEQLFGVGQPADTTKGVFLMVHEGSVVLAQENQNITLNAGESAFAAPFSPPTKLFSPAPLLDRDAYLSSAMFNANMCHR